MLLMMQIYAGIQMIHLVYLMNSIRSLHKQCIFAQDQIDSYGDTYE